VVYDVPEAYHVARDKIRRYLRARGFGCLQNSTWITPDPVKDERLMLAEGPVDVESLILLEARPCAGETDPQIVAGAWDFVAINRRYALHQKVLARRPRRHLKTKAAATVFYNWLREERNVWLEAVQGDPLLPLCLLPREYTGREAWGGRLQVMAEIGEQLRSFRL
jgi:phenylacetic acid degradation operon negative regulatory protein